MEAKEWRQFVISAAIGVLGGHWPPAKLLSWLNKQEAPQGMFRTDALMKSWLRAFDNRQWSEAQLRKELAYWLMGTLSSTSASSLAYERELKWTEKI